MTISSRSPSIDALLADERKMQAAAMGEPGYGIDAMMAFFEDYFRDPVNSGGEFVTPPFSGGQPDIGGAMDPGKYVQVQASWSFSNVNPGQKPRIVVTSGGIQEGPVGMESGRAEYNWLSGRETRQYLGTHRLNIGVYSTNKMTAERLGGLVRSAVKVFSPKIRQLLHWVTINAPVISGANPVYAGASSKPDVFMVNVNLVGMQSSRFTTMPIARSAGPIGLIVENDAATVVDEIATKGIS